MMLTSFVTTLQMKDLSSFNEPSSIPRATWRVSKLDCAMRQKIREQLDNLVTQMS